MAQAAFHISFPKKTKASRPLGRSARPAAPVLKRVARIALPIAGLALGGLLGWRLAWRRGRGAGRADVASEREPGV